MERKWRAAIELQQRHPSSLKKKKASISGICNVGPTSKSFKPTPLAPIIYRTESQFRFHHSRLASLSCVAFSDSGRLSLIIAMIQDECFL
ncbi:hypothetical protein Peur_014473 [Populus x canadensis]